MLNHLMLFIMDIKHVFCLILKKEQLIKVQYKQKIILFHIPSSKSILCMFPTEKMLKL